MRNIITHYRHLVLAIVAAIICTACEHKELCYVHHEHGAHWIMQVKPTYEREWHYTHSDATDWKKLWDATHYGIEYDTLRPEFPSGLRVIEYNDRNEYAISNIPAEGGLVDLSADANAVLAYNNGTEYIVFEDLSTYAKTRVSTRLRSRSTYPNATYTRGSRNEPTINQPDMLYCSYIHAVKKDESNPAVQWDALMKPVVFSYLIRFEFSYGQKYIAMARGALVGMAAGCYLHDGSTSADPATVLYDCTIKDYGSEALVKSFGVPGYPNARLDNNGHTYILELEVMMHNGFAKLFTIDVTDQVKQQPQGGVIVAQGLEITDEEGAVSGGFNVGVDGWGDDEIVEIPF